MAPAGAAAPEGEAKADDGAAVEATKKETQQATMKVIYSNIFQAVVQHVVVLQSEQALFLKASGGDVMIATKSMSTTISVVAILGLFINQLGGKMSDAFGRKRFFAVGPLINILAGLTVYRFPANLRVLMITRIAKLIGTTFSGTIMSTASMADTISGQDMAIAGTKISTIVGVAVVLSPFLESILVRLGRGDVRYTYLGLAAMAAAQMATANALPETLDVAKRVRFDLGAALSAMNPLGAMKIFQSSNKTLKQLVSMWMLMMVLEGKNLSDMSQVWMRDHIKWSASGIRNYVSLWGGAATLSGLLLSPTFLRKLSIRAYTTVANLGMAIGYMPAGFSESGTAFLVGLPFQLIGVNGATAHAIGPVIRQEADREGFGQGEFAAWMSNLRAIPGSLVPLLAARLYTRFKREGRYPGVIYPIFGFFGAVLPTAMLWAVVDPRALQTKT